MEIVKEFSYKKAGKTMIIFKNEKDIFFIINYIWLALAIIVFIALFFYRAPYGKYSRESKKKIGAKTGWIIMEIPAILLFNIFYFTGQNAFSGINWLFLIPWNFHYIYRAIIYPQKLSNKSKKISLEVILLAYLFHIVNSYLNARYISSLGPIYEIKYLFSPNFIIGIFLFIVGFSMHFYSDKTLLDLKRNLNGSYAIPRGGLFEYVSCPNYLGEIVEWLGWAIMLSNLPAFTFFAWTFANLFPRAISYHKWYKEKFHTYPSKRKAIIPFVI